MTSDTEDDQQTMQDGFTPVPPGKVATVVTHLEMRARPELRPAPAGVQLHLEHVRSPELVWYRALYRSVGQEWLWFSRLSMPDAKLAEILHDKKIDVYVLRNGTEECGLLELDFRQDGECELAFFGLTAAQLGSGAGRWLMNQAIELAYAKPIKRFHVHTCTHDHPAALAFYMRSGFVPYRQEIEVAPDPRLAGTLPLTAAPQVPIFDAAG